MKKRPIFITFEGGEGSGKSTHIKKVARFLKRKGLKVAVFYEPGSTALSEKIRNILLGYKGSICPETEMFLYLASRAEFVKERLIPALKKNDFVICDRFTDSTLVYQGYGLKLGMKKIKPLVEYSALGIKPDLTFFLDVKPQIGLSRIKGTKDRIEKRSLNFHQDLRKGYRKLAKACPDRIKTIETEDKEDTYQKIISFINEYL